MTWRRSKAALASGDFRKLFEAFSVGAGELAATLPTGSAPGEAHLVGKPVGANRAAGAVDPLDPLDLRLTALEGEIERRRRSQDGA